MMERGQDRRKEREEKGEENIKGGKNQERRKEIRGKKGGKEKY